MKVDHIRAQISDDPYKPTAVLLSALDETACEHPNAQHNAKCRRIFSLFRPKHLSLRLYFQGCLIYEATTSLLIHSSILTLC